MRYMKVSARSNPASVAGAIAAVIKDGDEVRLQSIGAGALNQAVKAAAIARSYLAPAGLDLVCIPAFITAELDGRSLTGMRLALVGQDTRAGYVVPADMDPDNASNEGF